MCRGDVMCRGDFMCNDKRHVVIGLNEAFAIKATTGQRTGLKFNLVVDTFNLTHHHRRTNVMIESGRSLRR